MYKSLECIQKYHNSGREFLRNPTVGAMYNIHKTIATFFHQNSVEYAKIYYSGLMMDCMSYVLHPNRFAYWTRFPLKHYLLWIKPGHEQFIHLERAKTIVGSILKGQKFVLFENPPNLQSLKGIKHYHVFCFNVVGSPA